MSTARPSFYLLSVASNLERHKIASGEPWVLLLLLQWPGNANPTATQQYIRLARNTDPVTFDANDGLGPQTYTPFNFEIGDLAVSSDGSVPETTVKVSNVMRVLQSTIEQYAGVVGANLTLFAVNTANPSGEPDLTLSFTIKQSICDAKLVTFKLGAASPLRRLFPIHMYRPNFCCWQYKSAQCGYTDPAATTGSTVNNSPYVTLASLTGIVPQMQLSGPGIPAGATILSITGSAAELSANATATASGVAIQPSFTTCSHTIDGATGCQAHFGNTVLRGLFFPGIDTNGAAIASVA